MTNEGVYLKPNVLPEPLIDQWYAWSYLIPPVPSAMYLVNSHLKIMQSFIAAPQVHAAAIKNPAMAGGTFMNCDPQRAGEVKSLLEETRKDQRLLISLAEDVKALDQLLTGQADGSSLEGLYSKVPAGLKGFVELFYDMHNNPSFRVIEALLYGSRYYDESRQSVALSLVNDDGRPFVFSTPRLSEPATTRLKIPFKDSALDELFKMKERPQPLPEIRERLGVSPNDETFDSFFTDQPARNISARELGDLRLRYFGHACVLMETPSVKILCDPVVSYRYDSPVARFTFDDLPEFIDYVLITHNHQDHCMFETLLQLRHKIGTIVVPRSVGGTLVDPSLKLVLQVIGFRNVRELEEMESIEVKGGSITGIPFLGEHADMNVRTKLAYTVRLSGKTMLCAADSNNIDPVVYDHIREFIGKIDILFIGMECEGAPLSWLYGPLLSGPLSRKADQSRRFDGSDCQKALRLVKGLNPGQVYVYAMGQEPWLTFLTSIRYTKDSKPIVESDKFVEECRSLGIQAERLFGCRNLTF
jgi:L-ascorbate metabolism protein UlaG (beta-lactamase superfamily)